MKQRELSRKEQQSYDEWLHEKEAIKRADPVAFETEKQKDKRIKELKGSFVKFCKYYFADMMDSEFGWFHKKAAKEVEENEDGIFVFEWPREHAKSVIVDVFITMWLKARGELTGVLLGSATQDKANGLLADIQEQLMFNKRFINDFGIQHKKGKWNEGSFVTADGIPFWAFGRGASPRGVRESEKRPNLGIIDDIDDTKIVKNEERVDDAVDWVLGDFYGAMPTTGSRLIVIGNRIHKRSILACIVGDVNEGDPKKEGIIHIKVFALENPKTHKEDMNGVPAWKERYTREMITKKMGRMGRRIALRELFHKHIVIGKVFSEEDLPWCELPPISHYDKLITYCDPSFRDTQKSDFKAIALIGQKDLYFDIIKVFCRQCKPPEMVRGHYDLAALVPENMTCPHWMEANFIQDIHLEVYDEEALNRDYSIGIRGDKRSKPEKTERIEALSAHTERRRIRFNQAERHNPDMIELRDQFLGFPNDEHDDGPDAVEGGIYLLNKSKIRQRNSERKAVKTGSYKKNTARRG